MERARNVLVWTILLCGGCVVVPVPVEPQTEQVADPKIPDEVLVSLEPRDLLEKLERKLVKSEPDIEGVDALTFRDTAFPDDGWRANNLLDPGVASRVADATNVTYVALVSVQDRNAWDEDFSLMVPLTFGAMSGEETSAMSVMIIDLRQPKSVFATVVTASGHSRGAFLVFYGLFFEPMTADAAENGIVEAIARAVTPEVGAGPVRIALLAAEGIAEDPDATGNPSDW